MNSAIERLLSLRVVDIMNKTVATIPEEATMSEAARILAEYDITGAPVVDAEGKCIGVLSSSDFAECARHQTVPGRLDSGEILAFSRILEEEVAENRVDEHMSRIVQTISDMSPITAAARVMCREHIHRLVIVDKGKKPIGVVSSLDIAAAMIAAIEE